MQLSVLIVGNKVDTTRSDVQDVKEKQDKTQHIQGKDFLFYFCFIGRNVLSVDLFNVI